MARSFDSFTIRIAGTCVTLMLAGSDDATRARIAERYDAFIAPLQPDAPHIHLRVEAGPEFIPIGVSQTWQIHTSEYNGRINFESYYEKGWVDYAAGSGELVMRPQGDPENFLRVLYAWLCLQQHGLLLHASGVISRGKGYVFFGPSGSGKTTVARLSLDRTVLSDDLVVLKKQDGVFRLFGVPFRGDFPEAPRVNASADLCNVFALVKDASHFVSPMSMSEAVGRLSACVPFVMTQPANAQRVTQICAGLAAQVPVQALHFRRDAGFWEVIDGLG